MGNLKAFSERKSNCFLSASIIVDHTNAGHIVELCQRLQENGVHQAKISPCILSDSGAKSNEYHSKFSAWMHKSLFENLTIFSVNQLLDL